MTRDRIKTCCFDYVFYDLVCASAIPRQARERVCQVQLFPILKHYFGTLIQDAKLHNYSDRKLHYLLRDYLGSITHIIGADGTLTQELSYDAWERLRNSVT